MVAPLRLLLWFIGLPVLVAFVLLIHHYPAEECPGNIELTAVVSESVLGDGSGADDAPACRYNIKQHFWPLIIRQGLHVIFVLLCLCTKPAFLLVDIGATVKDDGDNDDFEGGWTFLAAAVLMPDKLAAYIASDGKDVGPFAVLVVGLLDLYALVLLGGGLGWGHLPADVIFAYSVIAVFPILATLVLGVFIVGMGMCCTLNGAGLLHVFAGLLNIVASVTAWIKGAASNGLVAVIMQTIFPWIVVLSAFDVGVKGKDLDDDDTGAWSCVSACTLVMEIVGLVFAIDAYSYAEESEAWAFLWVCCFILVVATNLLYLYALRTGKACGCSEPEGDHEPGAWLVSVFCFALGVSAFIVPFLIGAGSG